MAATARVAIRSWIETSWQGAGRLRHVTSQQPTPGMSRHPWTAPPAIQVLSISRKKARSGGPLVQCSFPSANRICMWFRAVRIPHHRHHLCTCQASAHQLGQLLWGHTDQLVSSCSRTQCVRFPRKNLDPTIPTNFAPTNVRWLIENVFD